LNIVLHFLGIFKQVAYGACGTAVGGVVGGQREIKKLCHIRQVIV
jgi:hypothetical protein